MDLDKLRERLSECSLPAALEAMGERWSFMILRAAFNGLRHFEEFQTELGIARNILANRLARLVDHGIMERAALAEDRRKIAYSLTDKGHALLPTMVALRQWGERWETCVPAFPTLVDARDRRPIRDVAVLAHDGRVLNKGDLLWAHPGDIARDPEEAQAAEQPPRHRAPLPPETRWTMAAGEQGGDDAIAGGGRMTDRHVHEAHGHDHGHGHAAAHRHGHSHAHGHSHGHSHAPASFGRAFAIGTVLNLGFVVIEAAYGLMAGSMALLADAGHNLSDVASLLIAWGAATLATRKPGGRYTYGLKSSSILAAFVNALLLLVAIGAIAIEAIRRFADPAPVEADTVMIVAGIGIVINTATALLFMRGRHDDLNIRGAFLHMAADAAISAGVVVAGALIAWTGRTWIDPVTSLLIVVVIAAGTWGLLRDSIDMALHAAPPGIDLAAIEAFLRAEPGVADLHDLHVWPMSTTETALTTHLVVPAGYPGDAFTADLAHRLHDRFGIGHTTIQIETDSDVPCRLAPSGCSSAPAASASA